MGLLRTHPGLRLRPPSSWIGPKWVAENILTLRQHALQPTGVMVLVACMTPCDTDRVITEVSGRLRVPRDKVAATINALQRRELLIGVESSHELEWLDELRARWVRRGSGEAAEYHLLTYDYPFMAGTSEGREADTARMTLYREAEPDTQRRKTYHDAIRRVPLPLPQEGLVPAPAEAARQGKVRSRFLNGDALCALLSITFAKTGEFATSSPNAAPAMLRTSPSGGSRHPIEAYVVVVDVSGVEPGWYHVATDTPELELITDGVDREELSELFFGPLRAAFRVTAIVILTCVWERNMYRYRDPRTFRSVHMDAGHLTATMEATAEALGIRVFTHYAIDDVGVERKLGIEGLWEGAMLATALGSGANPGGENDGGDRGQE